MAQNTLNYIQQPITATAEGTLGATGATGPIGQTGARGPAGDSTAGSGNGSTGATGVMGPSGPTGPNGATGAGVTGATGIMGPTGSNGPTGPAGATGAPGPAATQGATGATGVQGPSGPTGVAGPSGPTGPSGALGATGPTGVTGATGIAGATGPSGLQGPTGTQGPTGSYGNAGVTGATGSSGATGTQGIQGLQGTTGATGVQGVQGITGATGVQGVQGVTGITGATGAGITGVTGPVGVTGATGPQGPTGTGLADVTTIDYLLSDGTDNWGYTSNPSLYSINAYRLSETLCGDAAQTGYGIEEVLLTEGGDGYTNSAPTVSFTGGGGSGAVAVATVAGGFVTGIAIRNGGSGYTSAPTVVIAGAGGVSTITITNSGSGYTSAPTVSFTGGGGGSGATATAIVNGGAIILITVTGDGTGYTSPPAISFSGGGGSGATATATIFSVATATATISPPAPGPGSVNSITLTSGGSGYNSYIGTFIGGTGTGASCNISVANNKVVLVQVTATGSGYRYIPGQIWYEPSVGFILNVGDRGITDNTAMNALLPNGVNVLALGLFPEGTRLVSKTLTTFFVSPVTYTKWVLTFSQSPIGGATYYECVFGIPTISPNRSMGSGGGWDYRVVQGPRRKYRIPPGNYRFEAGFPLQGITNAVLDCTGVVIYGYNSTANSSPPPSSFPGAGPWTEISDTSTKFELINLTSSARSTLGTLNPFTRGDSMPLSIRGSYNTIRNCTLTSGGDFGLRVGGSSMRSYGLRVYEHNSDCSWGDFCHFGNVDGCLFTNFNGNQAGDDGLALYSDAYSVVAQPTLIGFVTYANRNSAGSGYNNGTFLCNAVSGGAQANITVSGGSIINNNPVTNGGSGYTSGPMFDLSPLGGGTGGAVQGHLTWNGISGSWGVQNSNLYKKYGYQTEMKFIDSSTRKEISFALSNTNGGSLGSTITTGSFGWTGQPSLEYSTGGRNIVISNGIFKKCGWRGMLIGPYNWENIAISNVSFDGVGGHGIAIGDGADSDFQYLPVQKNISITGIVFKGIGVPQYRSDENRNIAQIFNLNSGNFEIFCIKNPSDSSTIAIFNSSNLVFNCMMDTGVVTYSNSNSTNVNKVALTAIT